MRQQILNSHCAAKEFKKYLKNDVEELWVMALSTQKQKLSLARIFKGTVDSCLCHPRDIFRFAIQQNASQIIISHNHPSECSKPSLEDIYLTKKIVKCGSLLGIPLIDHIILTTHNYSSLADLGYIKKTPHSLTPIL